MFATRGNTVNHPGEVVIIALTTAVLEHFASTTREVEVKSGHESKTRPCVHGLLADWVFWCWPSSPTNTWFRSFHKVTSTPGLTTIQSLEVVCILSASTKYKLLARSGTFIKEESWHRSSAWAHLLGQGAGIARSDSLRQSYSSSG